ncbi:hypothetical protein CSW58_08445 [Caulobacter sp. B11]|uniref:hypothetical protein n=1 Tax=Caulobacter sp. B11 TaxID=2048899 RepID=UPI000C12DC70|nr:hypothetical protein [Caulobacter sp. B11]PHY13043.1 hypothetical protein CSW58_08445 [Caulobacter sp. B11]
MSLSAIRDAFRFAAETGQVDGARLPLLGVLVETLGAPELPLSGGRSAQEGAAATLTGATQWRNTNWSLTITGQSPGGRDQLRMVLKLAPQAQAWTLGQAFPDLPLSRMPDESEDAGGGLTLTTSVLEALVVDLPAVLSEAADQGGAGPARLQGWLLIDQGFWRPMPPIWAARGCGSTGR